MSSKYGRRQECAWGCEWLGLLQAGMGREGLVQLVQAIIQHSVMWKYPPARPVLSHPVTPSSCYTSYYSVLEGWEIKLYSQSRLTTLNKCESWAMMGTFYLLMG